MRWHFVLVLWVLSASLAGCSARHPNCGDEAVTATATQIFDGMLDKVFASAGISEGADVQELKSSAPTYSALRTVAIDKDVGRVSCSASMAVQIPSKVGALMNSNAGAAQVLTIQYSSVHVENGIASADVTYTAQYTDDKKQVVVELSGADELSEMLAGAVTITALQQGNARTGAPVTAAGSPSQVIEIHGQLDCGNKECSFGNDKQLYDVGINNEDENKIYDACEFKECIVKAEVSGETLNHVLSAVKAL